MFCFSKDLANMEDVKNLIDRKDPSVEIVLTGRGTTRELRDGGFVYGNEEYQARV